MQTKTKHINFKTKINLSTSVHTDKKDLHRITDVLEDSLLREHPLK